jgi:hypothetical protein
VLMCIAHDLARLRDIAAERSAYGILAGPGT